MSGFSGAIKLADMNDYLALNQNCIKPLIKPSAGAGASSPADGSAPAASSGGEKEKLNVGTRRKVEMEFSSDASDLRFPGLQATGGASSSLAPVPTAAGHFDQMKLDPVKKTASVSLNDCLACSGCVTSAETVLITQQSTQEFLNVLEQNAASSAHSWKMSDSNVLTAVTSSPPSELCFHRGVFTADVLPMMKEMDHLAHGRLSHWASARGPISAVWLSLGQRVVALQLYDLRGADEREPSEPEGSQLRLRVRLSILSVQAVHPVEDPLDPFGTDYDFLLFNHLLEEHPSVEQFVVQDPSDDDKRFFGRLGWKTGADGHFYQARADALESFSGAPQTDRANSESSAMTDSGTPAAAATAVTSSAGTPASSSPRTVVVSLSPQSLTALAHHYHLTPLSCARRLTTFFKSIGVAAVLDTTPALDVALIEAREEFVWRYRNGLAKLNHVAVPDAARRADDAAPVLDAAISANHANTITPTSSSPLPILASECPGWTCYCEKTQGVETLSHMSSVRSAQAIMGALVKQWWASFKDIQPEQVYHVTVMPCYDKKLEGSRDDFYLTEFQTRETDCVLTTGEVVELLTERKIDLAASVPESDLEPGWFNVDSSGTALYRSMDTGGSGGYVENIYRYAAKQLFNVDTPSTVTYLPGRNPDFRELTLSIGNRTVLSFALAYGFRNIQNLVRKMKTKKAGKVGVTEPGQVARMMDKEEERKEDDSAMVDIPSAASSVVAAAAVPTSGSSSAVLQSLPVGSGGYHYVEVMACPSGCLNGGGQIKASDIRSQKQLVVDLDALYHARSVCPPEDNPIVQRIYREFLRGSRPYQGPARKLLHTQYHAVEEAQANPLGIKW